MKKTIFTFCSVAIVCCAIFFACAKDDNSITHVSYAQQNGNGTGGNPNPNGLPSNSGYGTTTATTSGSTTSTTSTGPAGTGSFKVNGSTKSATVVYASNEITGEVGSTPENVDIKYGSYSGTSYTIISGGTITSGFCAFTYNDPQGNDHEAQSGTITINTASNPRVATFTNIVCDTYTVSGTLNY